MKHPLAPLLLLLAAHAHGAESPTGGWVVLPVEDYRALREKAYPREPPPDRPPVQAALTRLDYDLGVAGDSASGTARLTIDVMTEGWVRVPIPSGLRVGSARLDGRPVAVVDPGGGQAPHVLLSKPERAVLTLAIVVPVASSAGTESLSLPPGQAAVTRATLVVPRANVDVSVGGGVLTERSDGKDESRWVVHGAGILPLSFSWRRKAEEKRESLPLRMRGALVQHVGFGEESAQLTASVSVEVVQGRAAHLALAVPEGVTVNRVSGDNVGDWVVAAGRLTVIFLEPAESAASLVVSAEARAPREGRLEVPLLRLAEAERETGGVAVEVIGAGEVAAHEGLGMDGADVADLGEDVAGRGDGLMTAFRFRAAEGRAPRRLAVALVRYTPQAVLMAAVEEARYDALFTAEGKLLVRARYAVRNNTQSFLVAELPATATLWSAAVASRPVRPGRSAEGAFLLPLTKAKAGEEAPAFVVELVYLDRAPAWARDGRARIALPGLDLPVSRTGLVLHAEPRYRVNIEPGAFREQAYRAPVSPAFGAVAEMDDREDAAESDEVQGFVDRARRMSGGHRVAGILPIQVPFPEMGVGTFLVSELTKEREVPSLEVRYKQTKGGRR